MNRNASIALLLAGAAAAVAAGLFALGAFDPRRTRAPNPAFSSPRATLDEYVRAVLAVDEDAELATAAPELRARTERQRGPDKADRRENLEGKSALFRDVPIRFVSEKVWGDNAKILLTQGGSEESPIHYVYTFRRIEGEWKITNMERTSDMRW